MTDAELETLERDTARFDSPVPRREGRGALARARAPNGGLVSQEEARPVSEYPRWMLLEVAALDDDVEPAVELRLPPPTTQHQPKASMTMNVKTCTKCGKQLRAHNTKGVCADVRGCATRSGSTDPVVDADDALLARVEASSVKPPPPAKKQKATPAEPTDLEEFFKLAEALGLDPQGMLGGWCRDWVSKTRAKALGLKIDGELVAEAGSAEP